jgi:hypothetical protein
MLPEGKCITVEDAARQIKVQPITLRQWLAIGTMPQFDFEGTDYVRQSDVDAFNEACQCRNQKAYKPKSVQTVVSSANKQHPPGVSTSGGCHTRRACSAPVHMAFLSVRHARDLVSSALQH